MSDQLRIDGTLQGAPCLAVTALPAADAGAAVPQQRGDAAQGQAAAEQGTGARGAAEKGEAGRDGRADTNMCTMSSSSCISVVILGQVKLLTHLMRLADVHNSLSQWVYHPGKRPRMATMNQAVMLPPDVQVLPPPLPLQPVQLQSQQSTNLNASGPFIFNPYAAKRQAAAASDAESGPPIWVCKDECRVEVLLHNPLMVPLKLDVELHVDYDDTPSSAAASASEDAATVSGEAVEDPSSSSLPGDSSPSSSPPRLVPNGRSTAGAESAHNIQQYVKPNTAIL